MENYEEILATHQNDLELTRKLLNEASLTSYLTLFTHYNGKTNKRLYDYLGKTAPILEKICSLLNEQISGSSFHFKPRTSSQNSTDITLTYLAKESSPNKSMLVYVAEISLYSQSFYPMKDYRQTKHKIEQQYKELLERIETESTEFVRLEKELERLEEKKTSLFYSEGKKELEIKELKAAIETQKNNLSTKTFEYSRYYDSIFGYHLLGDEMDSLYEIVELLEQLGIQCEHNVFKELKVSQLTAPINYLTIVADFEAENSVYITLEGTTLKDYIKEGAIRLIEHPLDLEPLASFGNITSDMIEIDMGKNKYLIHTNGKVEMHGVTSSIYDLAEAGILDIIDEQVKNMTLVPFNERQK